MLDCPPALDLLTLNALVAADGLLVPMQAEYFALEGITELMWTLDRVSQAFNPDAGARRRAPDHVRRPHQPLPAGDGEPARRSSAKSCCKTTIPRNIRLAEAPSHGKPVQLYDPRSKGAEAYTALALELLQRNGVASRKKRLYARPVTGLQRSGGEEKTEVLALPVEAEQQAERYPKGLNTD